MLKTLAKWVFLCRDFTARVLRRFIDEDFDQVSSSLAFTTLLSLVPLVAVVLGIMSVMPAFLVMVDQFDQVMRNMLPEHSAGLIVENVLAFSQKALNVTLVGLLILVATVLILLHTVENAFNRVWRTSEKRSWWRRLTLYSALIAVWPLAVAYVVAAISYAVTLSLGFVIELSWLRQLLSKATGVAVGAVFFAGLYYLVPHARVRLRDALFAGLFAAFGFLLMQKGFELYLSFFPSITFVYGAFATVPIFLLWLYLSWAVVLLGALIAATLPEFSAARKILPAQD